MKQALNKIECRALRAEGVRPACLLALVSSSSSSTSVQTTTSRLHVGMRHEEALRMGAKR